MVRRNELHERIASLVDNGWTLAAIADEMDIHYTTLARWRVGARYPENSKAVLMALDGLADIKPPPKRRYPQGHYLQRAKAERDRESGDQTNKGQGSAGPGDRNRRARVQGYGGVEGVHGLADGEL